MHEEFWDEIRHFRRDEFYCPCCGLEWMQRSTLFKLEIARIAADVPFIINSGCRCKKHNATMKHSSKTSSHLSGYAVDISIKNSVQRSKILTALIDAGFTRIGISKSFIHVDDDPKKPDGVIWLY